MVHSDGRHAFGRGRLGNPQAHAPDIISFADNATSCGGAVICSTNGTTGYLINGTGVAFDLSTINSWFQIDAQTPAINHLPLTQTEPEPNGGAGDFPVTNNTGAVVTSFSMTLTDTFSSTTPSVTTCTGAQAGKECDNFTIHGGAANYFSVETLSGPDWDSCTQGTTVGMSCMDGPGGAAANFAPNMVTYTWSAGTDAGIPIGATFLIDFASWQDTNEGNDVFITSPVPEPTSLALLGAGLVALAIIRRRQRPAARS